MVGLMFHPIVAGKPNTDVPSTMVNCIGVDCMLVSARHLTHSYGNLVCDVSKAGLLVQSVKYLDPNIVIQHRNRSFGPKSKLTKMPLSKQGPCGCVWPISLRNIPKHVLHFIFCSSR